MKEEKIHYIDRVEEVIEHFSVEGTFLKAEPYGMGHINDTFAVNLRRSDRSTWRIILQRINHEVIPSPEKLMENIGAVTEFLRKQIKAERKDPERRTLTVIKTREGKNFLRSFDGTYWRAYHFIEGATTYQIIKKKEHFANAGTTIGHFHRALNDFDVQSLHETIPDFHNTVKRYRDFQKALKLDSHNRAAQVRSEIDFVEKREGELANILNLIEEGNIPLRVTHNDTKFNNIMIDDITGEGICLIDLDTVMPGTCLYDFGDAIRFGANRAEEDERDLTKVNFDMELYSAFTRAYLGATEGLFSEAEIDNLAFSAPLMTLECGMRFLADHLEGDVYYKIQREGQNLDRARTQFKLVRDMEEQYDAMRKVVQSTFSERQRCDM